MQNSNDTVRELNVMRVLDLLILCGLNVKYAVYRHDGVDMYKFTFTDDETEATRVSYLDFPTVEEAEHPKQFVSLALRLLEAAEATDTMAGARYIAGLLRDKGYPALLSDQEDGVRVWFRGKVNPKSFYVGVDDKVATRIARGEEGAAALVAQAISFVDAPPPEPRRA